MFGVNYWSDAARAASSLVTEESQLVALAAACVVTMSGSAHTYRWYQDNASVTIDFFVPEGTLPTQVRLLLTNKRVTLKRVDGTVIVRRKTYAAIEPRCTDSYTMPTEAPDTRSCWPRLEQMSPERQGRTR